MKLLTKWCSNNGLHFEIYYILKSLYSNRDDNNTIITQVYKYGRKNLVKTLGLKRVILIFT